MININIYKKKDSQKQKTKSRQKISLKNTYYKSKFINVVSK